MNIISQRQSRRGAFILLLNNIVVWSAMAFYMPFIGAYYRISNLEVGRIGLLSTITALATIFVQPIWAYFSDKTGKRKLIFCLAALGASAAVLTYIWASDFPGFLRAALTMMVFSSPIMPLSDAIMTGHAKTIGADFAKIRIGGTVGFAFVVLVVGIYLNQHPASMFYFASGGFFFLSVFSFLTFPKDAPKVLVSTQDTTATESGKKGLFKTDLAYFVLAFMLTIQIGLISNTTFFGAFIVELKFDNSQFTVGMLTCIASLSEVPILLIINRLIKRFGTMKLLIFSAIMGSVRLVVASFGVMPSLIIAQCLQGFTYMIGHYTSIIFIREAVLAGRESQGQSVLVLMQTGIASIVGSAIAGQVLQTLGIAGGYRAMALILLGANGIVCLVYWIYLRRQKASQLPVTE